MTNPSSMHETGHSKPAHWNNPEGRNRGGHMYTRGKFISMYDKNHHNIGK